LGAQTSKDIIVWDLNTMTTQRVFALDQSLTGLKRDFPVMDRVDGICALSGDILFAHNTETKEARAYDLSNRGKTLNKWSVNVEYSRCPIG